MMRDNLIDSGDDTASQDSQKPGTGPASTSSNHTTVDNIESAGTEDEVADPIYGQAGSPSSMVPEKVLEADGSSLGGKSQSEHRKTIDRQLAQIQEMENNDSVPRTKKAFIEIIWEIIRPDFITQHLNWPSFKPVLRTWFAWWSVIVMMTITKVYTFIGTSSFLLLVAAFIEHSGGVSVTAGLLTSSLDLGFACFGIMHNVIGHSIAWKIRGKPSKAQCLQELVDKGLCPASPEKEALNCLMDHVQHGYFLNTKATVVSVFAMWFAFMACGFLPTRRRLFILPWMFSSIAICSTGLNLISQPWWGPWGYARSVIIPIGISLGVRFLWCCILFPTTSSTKFFDVLIKVCSSVRSNLDGFANEQSRKLPSDPNYDSKISAHSDSLNQALVQFGSIELDGLVSRYEICYSRLDPGNLGEFRSLVRLNASALSGLQFFHEGMAEKRDAICEAIYIMQHQDGDEHLDRREDQGPVPRPVRSFRRRIDSISDPNTKRAHLNWVDKKLHRNYKISGKYEMRRQDFYAEFNWDADHDVHMTLEGLDSIYLAIVDHYRELSEVTLACLTVCCKWMEEANKYRSLTLFLRTYRRKRRQRQIALAQEVAAAASELYNAINQPDDSNEWLKKTFHGSHAHSRNHYTFSLCQDSFYGYAVRQCAIRAEQLASYCMVMDKLQSRPRFIWPFTKSLSRKPRFESEYVSSESLDLGAAGDQRHFETFTPLQSVQRRDPDSSPPRTPFHLAGRAFQKVYGVFSGKTFGFLLKRSSVVLATGALYYFKPTAHFAYAHRMLWVPILVMFTISQNAADGIYGWASKMCFSGIGALVGMVVWYISTGNGHGNPYGLCAALGVAMVVVSFHRHYNKHRVPATTTVMTVTVGLVVGTSWIDARSVTQVELGYGFRVAWIRLVTVIVGLSIACLATMLPHPTTGKKTVRVTIGRCLENIGDLQSSISNFGVQRHRDPEVRIAPREDIIIQNKSGILSQLAVANATAKSLDFEPALGGVWPKHRYRLLIKIEREITQLYGHIHYLLDEVEDASRIPEILRRMGWTSLDMTSGTYSVLCLASRALMSGQPLPSITPARLSELFTKRVERSLQSESREAFEEDIEQNYTNPDGRLLLAALTMSAYIYEHVDGVMILVKSLVGEMYDTDPIIYDYDLEEQGPVEVK